MADRRRLHALFAKKGYVRVPNDGRRAAEKANYKKGWEVRLVAGDEDEADALIERAFEIGLIPGSAFYKGNQVVVPFYGVEAVEAFLSAHHVPVDDPRWLAVAAASSGRARRGVNARE